jgi:hypothetical protein
MDRQRIQEFIREHAPDNRVGQGIAGLDDAVRQIRRGREDIGAQLAPVPAKLHDCKFRRIAQLLAELHKLLRKNSPKQRPHAHAGEVIALLTNAFVPASVVPVLRVIQRQFHEPRERDSSAARFHFAPDFTEQLGVTIHVTTIAEWGALLKAKEHLQAGRVLVVSL